MKRKFLEKYGKKRIAMMDESGAFYSKDSSTLMDMKKCIDKVYQVKEGTKKIDAYISVGETVEKIVIPESVEEIGDFAFTHFKGEIVLPRSLKKLGVFVFNYEAKVTSNNERYKMIDKMLIDTERMVIMRCFSKAKIIDVPEEICGLEKGSFYKCEATKVNLGKNITYIGAGAFAESKNLRKMWIPQQISQIDANMFEFCENLEFVNLPECLDRIRVRAFNGCGKLKKLKHYFNCTWVDRYALGGCWKFMKHGEYDISMDQFWDPEDSDLAYEDPMAYYYMEVLPNKFWAKKKDDDYVDWYWVRYEEIDYEEQE